MAGAAKSLDRAMPSGPVQAASLFDVGRPMMAAAGPWLLTIAAVVLISLVAAPAINRAVVADFRAILIYAFSLSLVASAPFVLVVTRVLSDAIYLDDRPQAQPVVAVASAAAGLVAAALALVVGLGLFAMPAAPLFALVQAAGLTGMTWVHVAAASAMRDYTAIARMFLIGLLVAVAATLTVVLAWHGSSSQMAYAFNAGLAIIPVALAGREVAAVPTPGLNIASALAEFKMAARRYATVAVAGLLAAATVWIDKWIMWAGPSSRSLNSGLVHAPLYDSAAFLATLTIIPALTRFVSVVDGEYLLAYRGYFRAIKQNGTLDEIESKARALGTLTGEILESVFIMQAAICVIVVLCAPQIVEALNLQFAQVPILRLCTIATLFQLMFLVSCALLIFFERHREFLQLQALFLVLTTGGTALTLYIGPASYGFGLLVAAVVSGIAAYRMIGDTLANLNFLTFVEGAARSHQRAVVEPTSGTARWPRRLAGGDEIQ